MPKTPKQLFNQKVKDLLRKETRLEKAVIKHQRKLYELILSEFLPKFELKDGFIANNRANDKLILQIDNLFKKLEKTFYKDVLGLFAADLIKNTELNASYYIGLGFKKTVIDSIVRNKVRIEDRIGVTPTGRVRKNGYLYRLGQTDQVRQQLVNYVLNSLTGDVSFLDFQLGFRNLVVGNRRTKGLKTKGALEKYFDEYAYDVYNQTDSATNKQIAEELQLKHFIYEGSLIDTSRRFCEKRAGQAFNVKETKTWKNDSDLIEPKTKDQYRPLIDRGRYRCRHFIRYITEELYNALPDSKKGLLTI